MSWWVGSKKAIEVAEAMASRQVVGRPEYQGGQPLPPKDWVTERWAIPAETGDGRWFVPAHPDLAPAGVELVKVYPVAEDPEGSP